METYLDLAILFFEDGKGWHGWLAQHHEQPAGVWLKFAKKSAGIASLSYAPALEEALCFGWIDGQTKSIDEKFYLQKFTPRRTKSIWSKRNIGLVTELIKAGRMQPAGQAAIDAAKQDGRWEQAYDSPSNMQVPADFQAALDAHPKAKAFFATLNKTNTYAYLWRIATAKRAETRASRIEKFIAMLEAGEKLH